MKTLKTRPRRTRKRGGDMFGLFKRGLGNFKRNSTNEDIWNLQKKNVPLGELS